MKQKEIFVEEQKCDLSWMVAITGTLCLISFSKIIYEYLNGNNYMLDVYRFVFIFSIAMFLYIFFYSIRLTTLITPEGISIRTTPFSFKFKYYDWKNISSVALEDHNPFDFQVLWNTKIIKSKTFYIKSSSSSSAKDKAIKLLLNDGSKITIGTEKAEQLTDVIKTMLSN